MSRKRCTVCEQYYGIAADHVCRPARAKTNTPRPVGEGLPRSPLAPVPMVPATHAAPAWGALMVMGPGEAQHYAGLVALGRAQPRSGEEARQVAENRALAEARFGPIDWAA